jgi:hypothetical protein
LWEQRERTRAEILAAVDAAESSSHTYAIPRTSFRCIVRFAWSPPASINECLFYGKGNQSIEGPDRQCESHGHQHNIDAQYDATSDASGPSTDVPRKLPYNRPTVSYQLCATPYSAVAFAESRDSLGNGVLGSYPLVNNQLRAASLRTRRLVPMEPAARCLQPGRC